MRVNSGFTMASKMRCGGAAMYVTYTNSVLVIRFPLQLFLQPVERSQAATFEFLHPAVVDLVDGHRVQVVELLAPPPRRADETRLLEQREVLRHRLAAHVHLLAELAQREPAAREESVQELPPAGIRERPEDLVQWRSSRG